MSYLPKAPDMISRLTAKRIFIGREVTIAFTVIAILYLLRHVEFRAVQLPAYFLIVAYDTVEMLIPVVTPYYPVAFPIFLYALALIGAGITRSFQADNGPDWAVEEAVGGVGIVIGVITLLFAIRIGGPLIAPTDNPTPLAITTTTSVILLLAGWWLLGRPTTASDIRP